MGIFSKLFGTPSSAIENRIKEQYLAMFQTMLGMPSSEAKSMVHQLLETAKAEAQKEGIPNLPHNYGDFLLDAENKDEGIRMLLEKIRKDGVTNNDIRGWWNMHDLERRMMDKISLFHRMVCFTDLLEKGLKPDEVAKKVKKIHPIYGDSDNTTHGTGDDRPLPFELINRINVYTIKRVSSDPEEFKREGEAFSTMNALIRKEIRQGNL